MLFGCHNFILSFPLEFPGSFVVLGDTKTSELAAVYKVYLTYTHTHKYWSVAPLT